MWMCLLTITLKTILISLLCWAPPNISHMKRNKIRQIKHLKLKIHFNLLIIIHIELIHRRGGERERVYIYILLNICCWRCTIAVKLTCSFCEITKFVTRTTPTFRIKELIACLWFIKFSCQCFSFPVSFQHYFCPRCMHFINWFISIDEMKPLYYNWQTQNINKNNKNSYHSEVLKWSRWNERTLTCMSRS